MMLLSWTTKTLLWILKLGWEELLNIYRIQMVILRNFRRRLYESLTKSQKILLGTKREKPLKICQKPLHYCFKEKKERRRSILQKTNCLEFNVKSNIEHAKAAVKRKKRRLWKNKIIQLEKDFRSNRSHNLFKTARDLEKKTRKKHMAIKYKDTKRITPKNKVLKIWENHFKIYLNTKYPHRENALNSTPEVSSNLQVE